MAASRKAAINWEAFARSQAHPLKLRIVDMFGTGEEFSPMMLHTELGDPLGNVSYHVRALLDAGLIELVRTEPRRGAIEHFYRASAALLS
ncbi:MAG: helix-turn-helix transcriptional regulator [Solirubrobacteraceae bacterium]|nr:helix-turn-helix transcriptional regulator [Solirubrobacteraceae bacterium]